MVVLNEFVWMAVKKDIVAIHYNKVIVTSTKYDRYDTIFVSNNFSKVCM